MLEESAGATQASCVIKFVEMPANFDDNSNQTENVKACYPDVNKVDDVDFTISLVEDSTIPMLILIGKNDVKFLPKNLSVVLPELVAMRVSETAVTAVDENHFKGLLKLKFLVLEDNQIEYVPNHAFNDLTKLELLNLTNNKIQYIGKLAFSALSSLKHLVLGRNQIQFLHPEMFVSPVNVEEHRSQIARMKSLIIKLI